VLDAVQLDEFRQTGAVVMRGFFAPANVELWREQVSDFYERPITPEQWSSALSSKSHRGFHLAHGPNPHEHQDLGSLMRSFHPRSSWSGESELIVRPPDPDNASLQPGAPHLDFPIGRQQRDLVNTVLYLSDVGARGGAFMYWPGSHRLAWEYFRRNPLDYCARGGRAQVDTFRTLVAKVAGDAVEFTGAAGDLLVWHPLLLHSASINHSHSARIAIFGRWGSALAPDEAPFRFDDGIWAEPHWQFAA
jgi:Phytanoyl-CoA dioxygenase (PhyH)